MSYVEYIEKIFRRKTSCFGFTPSEFEDLFINDPKFEGVVDLTSIVRRAKSLRKNIVETEIFRENPLGTTKYKSQVLIHKKYIKNLDIQSVSNFRIVESEEEIGILKERRDRRRKKLNDMRNLVVHLYSKYDSGISISEFCDLYDSIFPNRGELAEIIRRLKRSNDLVGKNIFRQNRFSKTSKEFEILFHPQFENHLDNPTYVDVVISHLNISPREEDFLEDNFLLFLGDAIENMKCLDEDSIDLICVDLPYGISKKKWDAVIPFKPMWEEFNRITKENGAMVFTATQPFTTSLIASNIDNFRYDIIWHKTVCSGQMNVNKMPMRAHEHILVFYRKLPTYNEQITEGNPYEIKRKAEYREDNVYNKQKPNSKVNDGFRHAQSVIKISNPRIKGGHPTQKPLKLMEHIIKTYSNENDVVLDCAMGSGTTGVACANLNRKFVGIELDETYFYSAYERIDKAYQGGFANGTVSEQPETVEETSITC